MLTAIHWCSSKQILFSIPHGCLCSCLCLFLYIFLVAQRIKRLSAMQETWVRSLDQKDPLEKEMATHSSTLSWKVSRTKKSGRLQSMGSQRVRHD